MEVALLDRSGVVAVNPAWESFCLSNGGDLARCGVGASYLDACAADPGDHASRAVAAAIGQAAVGELPAPARVRLECSSAAEERWFDVLVSSRFDDGGICLGVSVTISRTVGPGGSLADGVDALLDGVDSLQVMEASADGQLLVDRDGTVVYSNARAGELTGYPGSSLTGRHVDDLVPDRFRTGTPRSATATPTSRPRG